MTEQPETGRRTPDLGLPTAGRKPQERAATSADDEPTLVTPPVALEDEKTTLLVPPPAVPEPAPSVAGEVTEPVLVVPVADEAPEASVDEAPEASADGPPVAVDDEPTVESRTPPPPPPEPGGETVRLDPATVVPPSGGAVLPEEADKPDAVSPEPVIAAKSPRPPWRRLSSAGALIVVLLALFGFTLVVQLRSNSADQGLATARQEDLVRILSDLEARDQRLQTEITDLEQSQRQLTSGVEGRQAALADAQKRADELGLLAGTVAGKGPGLKIVVDPKGVVKASAILNAVQELRGAGGEVMQINGADSTAVRIVASTYFVDADSAAITVDGKRLTGPYTIWVIGVPQTMQTALQIPGGVVASVNSAGGSVTMEAEGLVEVSALHKAPALQYARPVS